MSDIVADSPYEGLQASTSNPRKRPGSPVEAASKSFACDYSGCGKTFARADHLSRHKLNHQPDRIFQCDRCTRTFVRPDLLKRHAERHDKRELNGYEPDVKPGRIKGAVTSKKKTATFADPPTIGTTDALYGLPGPSSTSAYQTSIASPPEETYDHDRFTDLLAPQASSSIETTANMLLDFSTLSGNNPQSGPSSGPTDSYIDATLDLDRILGTGATAANITDTPFLSASESTWLFNNTDLRFQVPMPAQTQGPPPRLAQMDPFPSLRIWNEVPTVPGRSMSWPGQLSKRGLAAQPAPKPAPLVPPTPRRIIMTELARERLLDHLTSIPDLDADARFSLTDLDAHLARFFEWDTSHFSLLHRPTFEVDDAPPSLLCAIIVIGCYFASPDVQDLAREIHAFNLKALLVSSEFHARTDLPMIQASLLINVYGRTMSSFDDHEMSHIFYASFLTMYKRSALFNARTTNIAEDADLYTKWEAWKEEEASRRAAFMAYSFDIACAALFKQTGTLSAFQIQLTLPCYEDEWHAGTPAEWQRYHRDAPAPQSFLTTMKAFLMPGLTTPDISPLSRVVCLHGLLSVAFDMQWREHFLLGLSTHPDGLVKEWRLTLASAYNCWKTHFDNALTSAPTAIGTQLLRNSLPIYAVAHCTLAIDIDELQIFAGKRHALGLPVPPSVVETMRRRIITWSGVRGKEAAWHAAYFLRSSLLTRRTAENGAVQPMFANWCTFIACLCVHAYGSTASLARAEPADDGDAEPNPDPLAFLDAMCASSPEAIDAATIGSSTGLCDMISQIMQEETGWELAQDAARLLNWVASGGDETQ